MKHIPIIILTLVLSLASCSKEDSIENSVSIEGQYWLDELIYEEYNETYITILFFNKSTGILTLESIDNIDNEYRKLQSDYQVDYTTSIVRIGNKNRKFTIINDILTLDPGTEDEWQFIAISEEQANDRLH